MQKPKATFTLNVVGPVSPTPGTREWLEHLLPDCQFQIGATAQPYGTSQPGIWIVPPKDDTRIPEGRNRNRKKCLSLFDNQDGSHRYEYWPFEYQDCEYPECFGVRLTYQGSALLMAIARKCRVILRYHLNQQSKSKPQIKLSLTVT